jgi:K+-sensing histidine kinase KdpD
VARVRSKLESALGGRSVQVSLSAERAWGDPEAISRMVELLLVNAARFSPLGSGITVGSRPLPGATLVSVTDQGQGIAAKHLPHIFEPFYRADVSETRVSRGAGLGLFIVKELAERHGGSVRVSSTQGRGSTISVELPGPGLPWVPSYTESPTRRPGGNALFCRCAPSAPAVPSESWTNTSERSSWVADRRAWPWDASCSARACRS